jgi:hypothetical protein
VLITSSPAAYATETPVIEFTVEGTNFKKQRNDHVLRYQANLNSLDAANTEQQRQAVPWSPATKLKAQSPKQKDLAAPNTLSAPTRRLRLPHMTSHTLFLTR